MKDPARFQVAVADEQGILVVSYNKIALGTDVADREYFKVPRENRRRGRCISAVRSLPGWRDRPPSR